MSVLVLIDAVGGTPDANDRRVIAFAHQLSARWGAKRPILCVWPDGDLASYRETGCDLLLVRQTGKACERAGLIAAIGESDMPATSSILAGCSSFRASDVVRWIAAMLEQPPLTHRSIASLAQAPSRMICALLEEASCPAVADDVVADARVEGRGEQALAINGRGPQILSRSIASTRDMLPELAPRLVSAGMGVSDWDSFYALAEKLDAAIASTRSVCDANLLPRERQVGTSGAFASSELYLALGISGAPQHLQGISACRHVLAVNIDPHAPIVARADLSVIGDAQQIMPALLTALADERQDSGHG